MQIPAAKIYFPEDDRKEILEKIDGILQTGQLTLGKYTRDLEEKFAEYTGTKYAVAVNSGTSALEIILRTIGVDGSSVVVPTNTFFATPASVVHAGGRVIFADASDNLCLDPASLLEAIEEDTKAVILVHIGGVITPQIDDIKKICDERNIFLVEDAAHAHGSTLKGQKAGSFGYAAAFSFYPTKVITSGEGGIITTDDEDVYNRAQVFRDQGKAGFLGNIHTEMGYNWRMSEVHAVVGLYQFSRLDEFIAGRQAAARVYDEELANVKGITPLEIPPEVKSNYYKYVALLDRGIDRASFKKSVKERYGVGLSGEVYELPCHSQPVFKSLHQSSPQLPIAEDLCRRHICLPVFAEMTGEQARYVTNSIKEAMNL